jgi:hypothetical protein
MKVGYFIDPCGRAIVVEIPKDLNGYYKLLGCNTIDITRRKIGGKYYDIICDDEGLFKETVMVSAVDGSGSAMLVGKLLICNHDENGNEASLTQDDILNIEANICRRVFVKGDY